MALVSGGWIDPDQTHSGEQLDHVPVKLNDGGIFDGSTFNPSQKSGRPNLLQPADVSQFPRASATLRPQTPTAAQ